MSQAEYLKVVLQQDRLEKRAKAFVRNAEGPLELGEKPSLRRLGLAVGQNAVRHVQQDAQPLILVQEGGGLGQEIVGLMGLDILHRAIEQGPVAGPDLDEVGRDLAAEGGNQPPDLARIDFPVHGDAIDQRNRKGEPGGHPFRFQLRALFPR
jgi:hypothetical protein